MRDVLAFWLIVEVVGVLAVPVAAFLYAKLPSAGLALARPLGLLLIAYPAWFLASVGLAPYGRATALLGLALLGVLATVFRRRAVRALRDRTARRVWLVGELIFAMGFAGCTLLRSFAPDIWNTEKPMDMAFVNAVNRSESFPPHDPWFAGEALNYYYYGHYLVALIVRVTGTAPEVGFNLAIALFYGLVASAVFAVASSLVLARDGGRMRLAVAVGAGTSLIAVGLGTVAGATELRRTDALREYDWWSPSRVIDGTANEFPIFSYLLGDLHAHVMVTPFALLVVAYALQVALSGPRLPRRRAWVSAVVELGLVALVLGSLYAVNSLDLPTGALLVAGGLLLWLTAPGNRLEVRALVWLAALLTVSGLLFLPFIVGYHPTTDGVGLVREHDPFSRFLGDLFLIYALPLLVVAAAVAGRLKAPRRYVAWFGAGFLFLLVLLAPWRVAGLLLVLTSFGVALHAFLDSRLDQAQRFFWLLVASGLGLIAVGDFAYIRDVFDGTSSYRFNTVFKAGYQAWFLLSIAAGVGLVWAREWLRGFPWRAWQVGVAVVLVLLCAYPVAGTYARTNEFSRSPTLDGLAWLDRADHGDAAAIDWLRANADGAAVVLEAVGPDFSSLGHARISTFTGLPTVLGWAGHVLQWGHDPGTRTRDVRTMYVSSDVAQVRRLLTRYGVRYIVVGSLEQRTYPKATFATLDHLARPVFRSGGTTVHEVTTRETLPLP